MLGNDLNPADPQRPRCDSATLSVPWMADQP